MKFEVKQTLNGTVDEVERALFDERYLPYLLQHSKVMLEAQVQEKKDNGGTISRKVRYRTKPVIESIGPKKVPAEFFAFVEESTYDKGSHTLTFTNVPTTQRISKMVLNKGTLSLRQGANNTTDLVMQGDIILVLPWMLKLLAPIGEGVIKNEGLKILDDQAKVTNQFLVDVLRKT